MKVLIALDNSEFGDAALRSVLERPWWGDTEFLVMSVVPILAPVFSDGAPHWREMLDIQEADKRLASELVTTAEQRLKKSIHCGQIDTKIEEGNIIDKIIATASDWGADLIVLGSHGRTGIKKFLLGSVAESVLNQAPCSVEIVKEKPVHVQAEHESDALAKV